MFACFVRRAATLAAVTAGFGVLLVTPASAVAVSSTVSVNATGDSRQPAASEDGRLVAFVTDARLLPSEDADFVHDVYLRDTESGSLELISKNTRLPAENPAITPSGRFVAYDTASQLATQDQDRNKDVYRYDRLTGQTLLVSRGRLSSVDTFSQNGEAIAPSISDDGNRVAFESAASDLVDGDTNGRRDAFVREILADLTFRVSVNTSEGQAVGGDSTEPAISGDGRYVAFTSGAINLATGDTDAELDVFRRDTQSPGTTILASVGSATGGSTSPSISGDGKVVAFQSIADLAGGSELICSGPFEGKTPDVFVFRPAESSSLTVVSAPAVSAGHDIDDIAMNPSVSADGRRVAFTSAPLEIVGCPNPHPDPNDPDLGEPSVHIGDDRIMLRELTPDATTIRVDRSSSGQFANRASTAPAIAAGGRAVTYVSDATNLAAGATGPGSKAFLTRLG